MDVDIPTIIKWTLLLIVGGLMIAAFGYILRIIMSSSSSSPKQIGGLMKSANTGLVAQNPEFVSVANDLMKQVREIATKDTGSGLFAWLDEYLDEKEIAAIDRKVKHINSLIALADKVETLSHLEDDRIVKELDRARSKEYHALLHQTRMMREAMDLAVHKAAAAQGRSVASYEALQGKQDDFKIEMERIEKTGGAEVNKARQLDDIAFSGELKRVPLKTQAAEDEARIKREAEDHALKLRIKEKESQNEIDLKKERGESEEQIVFATRTTTLKAHEDIRAIRAEIDELNKRIDAIEALSPIPSRKRQECDSLIRSVDAYYEEIKAIEAGLRKIDDGEKSQGNTPPETRTPRDAR